ncbi:MAG: hypothetical protein JST10_10035 [Bacteroidetes bacterium]|nr:hypothetical protein [Bacteroidota bacterium]
MIHLPGFVRNGIKKCISLPAFFLLPAIYPGFSLRAQTAEEVIMQVRSKIEKVNDYVAQAKLKTNVVFIKAPIANVKIYFKKPDKIRIHNISGISFIPKGSVNISLSNVFADISAYDIIDVGKDESSGLRSIKLLPKSDTSDVVLAGFMIDDKKMLIKKATITTRNNGTYELQMSYGKYADYGLADKVIFSFNTREYKLPKGVTFDYDEGTSKKEEQRLREKKGKVEINYLNYTINKGVADSFFQ